MADKVIKICDRCKKEYSKDKNSILSFENKELNFKKDFCPICANTFLGWAITSENKGKNKEIISTGVETMSELNLLIDLYNRLVDDYNDNIPFSQSGAHLLVAKENNRRFIGCELDPKWFNIAKDRLEIE